jgi:hypothetical protein
MEAPMEDQVSGPVPPRELRVSDAERETVLESLREHTAAGRLTMDEFTERADQVLRAKTYGELENLTRDLPPLDPRRAAAPPLTPALGDPDLPRQQVRWMVAIMSGSRRRGRLRLAGEVNLLSIMGGDELDLRQAEFEGGQVRLNAISIMGGATIYVLDTVNVDFEGISIMGGNCELGAAPRPSAGAPTLRIRTYNLMGGCTLWRLPEQARDVSLRDARHLAKSAHRQLGPPHPSDD